MYAFAEDDLLFALPVEAIRVFLNGPFPEWRALVDECRAAEGLGPSDSVDWKTYALEHYRLPAAALCCCENRRQPMGRFFIRQVDCF